jgi:hypothetical protein
MTLPEIATSYFGHLSAGSFAAAAACFSADGFYSHPPYDPGSDGPTGRRIEARGRAEIESVFGLRGPRDWHHELASDTIGRRFYVEGVVRTSDDVALLSYLSVGDLDDDGLICRYVAYDSRPPVGLPRNSWAAHPA